MENKLNNKKTNNNVKNPLLNELKRIFDFYKKRYDILIVIIIITLIINDLFFMKNHSKNSKNTILKGGGNLSTYLLNTSILDNLKQQFPLENNKTNYIMVGFGYFILAFVVRPIKAFFIFILIIFAISGSFIFPFLIFGTLLYFVIKKVITNNKPSIELL